MKTAKQHNNEHGVPDLPQPEDSIFDDLHAAIRKWKRELSRARGAGDKKRVEFLRGGVDALEKLKRGAVEP